MKRYPLRLSAPACWAGAAILLAAMGVLFVSRHKFLDPDECENLYAAWLIFQGQCPYRDFYQLHFPLLFYLLSPMFLSFKSLSVIEAARTVIYLVLLVNGILLFKVGRRLFDERTAAFGLFFYFISWPIMTKIIEVRPDVLALVFANLALLALLSRRKNGRGVFFVSGVLTAVATSAKQSGAIFLIAMAFFFLIRKATQKVRFWDPDIFPDREFNGRAAGLFLSGYAVFWGLSLLFFTFQGALGPFWQEAVHNDFLKGYLGLGIEAEHWMPFYYIRESLWANPLIFAAALFSPWIILNASGRDARKIKSSGILVLVLWAVFSVSLFLIIHPWLQDFAFPAQYMSLLAGLTFGRMSGKLYEGLRQKKKRPLYLAAAGLIIVLVCGPILRSVVGKGMFFQTMDRVALDKIISLTDQKDKCLSLRYPCLFRPSVYYYRVGSFQMESPTVRQRIEQALLNDVLSGGIVTIVPFASYCQGEMTELVRVIKENYVMFARSFYVPGRSMDIPGQTATTINILADGYYRFGCRMGSIRLNGQPLESKLVYLTKGSHILENTAGPQRVWFTYDPYINKRRPR